VSASSAQDTSSSRSTDQNTSTSKESTPTTSGISQDVEPDVLSEERGIDEADVESKKGDKGATGGRQVRFNS
jgi:hypothetical protein